MAANLQCPKCRRILIQKEDKSSLPQNAYRVYESQWNSAEEKGLFVKIECLACKYIGDEIEFED